LTKANVIKFLRKVAGEVDVLDLLKVKSKGDVIAAAEQFGFPFAESEFDSLVWDLEVYLASKRGERFDPHFALWQTMWGKYYLEYLVADLLPSFDEADIEKVMTAEKNI
jgi:hypothetical protein